MRNILEGGMGECPQSVITDFAIKDTKLSSFCTYAGSPYCAAVGFSAVESANTVGYNTITVAKGSTTAIGVQFENVDGTDGIPVKSIVTVGTPLGATAANAAADQIWTFDGYTWTKYYFYKRGSVAKWCLAGSTTEIGDNVTIGTGSAFFFVRSTSASEAVSISFKR